MNYIKLSIYAYLLCSFSMIAQSKLDKQTAVEIALENNFDIRISNNDIETAKNNASIYNSGFLPSISATSNASLQRRESENEFQDGRSQDDISKTQSFDAGVGLDYVLFDGLGRMYNYRKLKELYNISEIRAREVIENTLFELLTVYYDIARLTENKNNLQQSLDISKSRLLREKYSYEYGQNTNLDVSNSEVDVNNDSINLLNIQRELANSKRNLNLILGRDVQTSFEVDTTVSYAIDLSYEKVLENAKKQNAALLQAKRNITLSDYDLKINQSNWIPSVGLNSSYTWSGFNTNSNNSNAFSLAHQRANGFFGGLSLRWNVFDGGLTKTRIQNAKIEIDNSNIQKQQIELNLNRTIANAWETYQNALFILQAEKKNVETNKINFNRSEEQFKLGQILSVEFRTAQLNLLNAVNNYNQAKYAAKVAELALLQLGGTLINATSY